jgi:hypothetical protein
MQSSWVDRIFEKLALRYGRDFAQQYEGLDVSAVKAEWAEVLDGVKRDSVQYAFAFLPSGKPPNAMQFRDLCRKAPSNDLALPAPQQPPADIEKVREIMARLRPRLTATTLTEGGEQ